MIDGHVHVWRIGRDGCTWPRPDLAGIYRDFGLDDLRREEGAPEGVVLIQSQEDEADTEMLLGFADDPAVLAIVGWTDLEAPDAAAAVTSLAREPKLRGLRPMVQDREDLYYDRPRLEAGLRAMADHGLVLDALVRPRHLPALARLALRFPELDIVVDHGAKPDFHRLEPWARAMRRVAALPNISCKLSGLLTELPAGAAHDAVRPVIDLLWEMFGPERLIWGSDWPVLNLAGLYGEWRALAARLLPSAHHDAVFDGNARSIYRMADAPASRRLI
ncbi:MAG: hypothetical protein JWO25_276 [Alphaproteobacteria bacterium]|nr:hypothetical protein [Alphaproteobacteria bacterium]